MIRQGEFDRIKRVLDEVNPDGPLTAREIADLLADHGEDPENPHRVATVLGRRAEFGDVDVIRDQPYQYQFDW